MTTSLKHTTCLLAIGITLSSGIVLGQEARPAAVTPPPSGISLAQERTNTSASFRESIRRELAGQRLVVAGQQQPPLKQKSWAERHKGGLIAAVIVAGAFAILAGYFHARCAGDEC